MWDQNIPCHYFIIAFHMNFEEEPRAERKTLWKQHSSGTKSSPAWMGQPSPSTNMCTWFGMITSSRHHSRQCSQDSSKYTCHFSWGKSLDTIIYTSYYSMTTSEYSVATCVSSCRNVVILFPSSGWRLLKSPSSFNFSFPRVMATGVHVCTLAYCGHLFV